MKKLMFALVGAIALAGVASFATVDEYLYWRPADVQKYDFDTVQRHGSKTLGRVVTEEVSKSVLRKNIGPVTGAVLMDEVLTSYRDMRRAAGEGPAIALAIDIIGVWDQQGARQFEKTFGGQVGDLRERYGNSPLYIERLTRAKQIADYVREDPVRPDDETKWFPFLGAKDPDIAAGSLPFSGNSIEMPEVPSAFELGTIEDELDLEIVVTATRIANHRQKLNSVFWQGSDGFAKGAINTGLNPSDLWQIILHQETAGKITEDKYVDLAAGVASSVRDAAIATWRIKYRDWTKRPSMRVPKLEASIGNPSFPGYVSGHATMAAAAAHYLSIADKSRATIYRRLARDSAKSRLFGGVHTVSDNQIGIWLGKTIASQHLHSQAPTLRPVYPSPERLRWVLNALNWTLDIRDDTIDFWKAATSDDNFHFRKADVSPPAPRAKSGPRTGNDFKKGSVAAADLDGDGLPEILVAGYRSVRLYSNSGGMKFERVDEVETTDVSGAYFTKNDGGEVDGFWAFGDGEPIWHRRISAMKFSPEGERADGFPANEDLNIKGMVLRDMDNDGDEDAVFLNYGQVSSIDGFVKFDEKLRHSHFVERTDEGYLYKGSYGDSTGRPFAAGQIDLDGNGTPEEVIVHDGLPLEIHGLEAPLDEKLLRPVWGMSFTPIRVGNVEAMHISNIYDGEHELYEQEVSIKEKDEAIDGDLLVGLSADGVIEDLGVGMLQTGPLEWSWGSQSGDLNGDGLEDLVIVYGITPNRVYKCGVRILLQKADGSFEPARQQIDIGEFYPRSILLRDLDGDEDLDIVMSSWDRSQVWENISQAKPGVDHSLSRPDIRGFLTQDVRDR